MINETVFTVIYGLVCFWAGWIISYNRLRVLQMRERPYRYICPSDMCYFEVTANDAAWVDHMATYHETDCPYLKESQ